VEDITRQNRKQMTTLNTPKANDEPRDSKGRTHQTKKSRQKQTEKSRQMKKINPGIPTEGCPGGQHSHVPPAPPEALGGADFIAAE
jgi:hypothetical protein